MLKRVYSPYLGHLYAFSPRGSLTALRRFLSPRYHVVETSILGDNSMHMIVDEESAPLCAIPIDYELWVFKSEKTGEFMGYADNLDHFAKPIDTSTQTSTPKFFDPHAKNFNTFSK